MMRNKHILFVQHAGVGGAFISLKQLIETVIEQEMKVTVLLLRNDKLVKEEFQKIGVDVIVKPDLSQVRSVVGGWINFLNPVHSFFAIKNYLKIPCSFWQFNRLIKKIKPDIVYLNSLCVFLYAKTAKRSGARVFLHIREMYLKNIVLDKWHRKIIERHVDTIFGIGKDELAQIKIEHKNCFIVKNYVDVEKWSFVERKTMHDPVRILYTGGLNSIKGYQVLLDALVKLNGSGTDFICIFLGVDSQTAKHSRIFRKLNYSVFDDFTKKICDFGIAQKIELLPFTPNPVETFKNSDMLVFPSTAPHFPRPIIEAGAVGIPVIASNLSGPKDAVENGITGLLIEPNDPFKLAEAIRFLTENPEISLKMGIAGREKVEKEYNKHKNIRLILSELQRY